MATLIEKYAFQSWSWVRNLVLYELKTTKDEIFFCFIIKPLEEWHSRTLGNQ